VVDIDQVQAVQDAEVGISWVSTLSAQDTGGPAHEVEMALDAVREFEERVESA
jgi:hypothetical protein